MTIWYQKEGKCSLCDGIYTAYGNNPEPVGNIRERCCNDCNQTKVIPARLKAVQEKGGW